MRDVIETLEPREETVRDKDGRGVANLRTSARCWPGELSTRLWQD